MGTTDSLLGSTADCRLDLIWSEIFSCHSSHSTRLRNLQLMVSIKGPDTRGARVKNIHTETERLYSPEISKLHSLLVSISVSGLVMDSPDRGSLP